MPQIIRSDRAEADLVDILVYLRSHSSKAADRFEKAFRQRCETLAQFPFSGRSREELAPGL